MTTLLLILKTGDHQDHTSVSAALLTIRAESLFDKGIISFELIRSVIDPLVWYVRECWEDEPYLFAHLHRLRSNGSLVKIIQRLSLPPEFIKLTR